MSKEQRSLLITIIAAIVTAIVILMSGGAVNAAPQYKVFIYHRDGSVESLDNVDYVKPIRADNTYAYTSVIEMRADGVVYLFYNSEVKAIKDIEVKDT